MSFFSRPAHLFLFLSFLLLALFSYLSITLSLSPSLFLYPVYFIFCREAVAPPLFFYFFFLSIFRLFFFPFGSCLNQGFISLLLIFCRRSTPEGARFRVRQILSRSYLRQVTALTPAGWAARSASRRALDVSVLFVILTSPLLLAVALRSPVVPLCSSAAPRAVVPELCPRLAGGLTYPTSRPRFKLLAVILSYQCFVLSYRSSRSPCVSGSSLITSPLSLPLKRPLNRRPLFSSIHASWSIVHTTITASRSALADQH